MYEVLPRYTRSQRDSFQRTQAHHISLSSRNICSYSNGELKYEAFEFRHAYDCLTGVRKCESSQFNPRWADRCTIGASVQLVRRYAGFTFINIYVTRRLASLQKFLFLTCCYAADEPQRPRLHCLPAEKSVFVSFR